MRFPPPDIYTLFSGARGSYVALSAAGHAGRPPVHHGAKFWEIHPSAVLLHCRKSSLLCGSHSTTAIAHQVGVDHYYVCVWPLHMRVCSVWAVIRVRESRCVRVLRICVLAPHGSAFLFFFFFCSACCCCCRIKSSVSHRPSGAQALYFVADTVQQQ